MTERSEMAKKKRKKGKKIAPRRLAFTRRNWLIFCAGIITISVGFYVLSKGSTTLAPILLVFGYCVVVPLAILLK
jgi:hypothetical protein